MSGKAAQMDWDAAADRKLFLAIIHVHAVKVDYEKVAECMATEEASPTVWSIRKRFTKLKALATEECGGRGDSSGTAEKATRKRAKAATTSNPRKHTTKGTHKTSEEEDDDDDETAGFGFGTEGVIERDVKEEDNSDS
ncbi:hypothetical protein LTR62_000365 [Meristemomyces frigidus]|uniref:Uncharacterized protein n=1 Tax=Meristemomyces frigidus TaxID=1508187 RepID=A0AAN7YQV5_9PEZI|nr:hypothetical protein LTR62_000365 [Meristemomyces frigidus]